MFLVVGTALHRAHNPGMTIKHNKSENVTYIRLTAVEMRNFKSEKPGVAYNQNQAVRNAAIRVCRVDRVDVCVLAPSSKGGFVVSQYSVSQHRP